MELLIEKMPADVNDLMIESMDIILHCLDLNNLKNRTLNETFPAISKFPNVTFCPTSRRIAVGGKTGVVAIFELRTPQKSQIITAHAHPLTCCAFSPDGKHLSTYSMDENKICFWSTATSLFGLGQSQIKCIRTYNTKPASSSGLISLHEPVGQKAPPRLIWVANKALILMFADGSECRYNV
jgi:WD40 repeat protein